MDLAELRGVRVARSTADLRLRPEETYLGGGSWLYSTPQPHVRGLVDLAGMGWAPVAEEDDGLLLAATCSVAELRAAAAGWRTAAPERGSAAALVDACAEAFLMSFKVWRVATLGGNLCLALPAGAMISLCAALQGEVELWDPLAGVEPIAVRHVPVVDFVTGAGATVREPGEVVRGIRVDAAALRARYAFAKTALTSIGRSSAVVTGRLDASQDAATCTVTVTAATTRPVALHFDALPSAAALVERIRAIDVWYADPHGPADWRAGVTEVLAQQVLEELQEDAP